MPVFLGYYRDNVTAGVVQVRCVYKQQHSTCHAAGVPCRSWCFWCTPGSPAYLTPCISAEKTQQDSAPGEVFPLPHSCFCSPIAFSSFPVVETGFRSLTFSGGEHDGKETKTETRTMQESLFMLKLFGLSHWKSQRRGKVSFRAHLSFLISSPSVRCSN